VFLGAVLAVHPEHERQRSLRARTRSCRTRKPPKRTGRKPRTNRHRDGEREGRRWKTIVATRTPPTSVQGGGIDLTSTPTNSGSHSNVPKQHPARDRRADTQGGIQSLKRTVHRSARSNGRERGAPAFTTIPRSASRGHLRSRLDHVQGTNQQIMPTSRHTRACLTLPCRDGWLAIEWTSPVMTGSITYRSSIHPR